MQLTALKFKTESKTMIDTQIKNYDKYMLLATMPLIFCGVVLHGPRVLLICLSAMITARIVDVLVSMVRHADFDKKDNSSVQAAIIFSLLMPVNIPFYVINITVGLVVLIGKHAFGGKGVYPFNLAALATCVASVNWPDKVFAAVAPFSEVNLWTGETANAVMSNAAIIKEGGVPAYSLVNMLLGNYPGAIGSDFILVIAAISIFMIYKKLITWHAPVTFLLTTAGIALLFPRIYGFPRFASVEMELLNGAVLYSALFMLSEPTTTPKTAKGKIVFGFLVAALGMLFRYKGNVEFGISFALLMVNATEGFIDRIVNKEDWFTIKTFTEIKNFSAKTQQNKEVVEAPAPAEKAVHTAPASKTETMELISEVEDNIDNVIFSTRTIDINEVLRLEKEQKDKKAQEEKKKQKKRKSKKGGESNEK